MLSFINKLDASKGGGIDCITNKMLIMCSESISGPIAELFNKIFELHQFPDIWKEGLVVPLFKRADKSKVQNYRPVTLLNAMSKLIESVIFKRIFDHMSQNTLFYIFQSGFLPGHGTIPQLVHIIHSIHEDIVQGKHTRAIFLDLASAFDVVPHHLLIKKLSAYGIKGGVLNLLQSYLTGRKVKVNVDGRHSEWSEPGYINAGVPQGSVLGPLLFLIYINDLPDELTNRVYINISMQMTHQYFLNSKRMKF